MLTHQLMLDIPALVVQMLLAIPGVTAVRISETAKQLPMVTVSAQPTQQFFGTTIVTSNPTVLPTGLLSTGHLRENCW